MDRPDTIKALMIGSNIGGEVDTIIYQLVDWGERLEATLRLAMKDLEEQTLQRDRLCERVRELEHHEWQLRRCQLKKLDK